MLVAISGSQGAGKTTVLNLIKEQGYNIIERKTSRSILQEWGVSLKQVNDDHDLTIKFQNEILKRKFEDEKHAVESNDVWFTERTFADLFTYALIALGKDNGYSDWLDEYYEQCKRYNQIYRNIFYIQAGLFIPEHDGVRGSNQHYSRMVDLVMYEFTDKMSAMVYPQLKTVGAKTPEERVSFIVERSMRALDFPLMHPILLSNIVG